MIFKNINRFKLNIYIEIQKKIIPNYEINKCIKQYHNGLLYGYLKIIAMMEIF